MTTQPGQPRDRRGTVGHPYSALNLRLLLASAGIAIMVVLAILLFVADQPVLAIIAAVLVVVGVIDSVVVLRRIRARRRQDPNRHYSLFE